MTKAYDDWMKYLYDHRDEVKVVDENFGEDASMVVCRLVSEPLLMKDNLLGTCTKCFRMVQFRPHAPKTPPKMCDKCASKQIAASREAGDTITHIVTDNTALDLAYYAKKKRMH